MKKITAYYIIYNERQSISSNIRKTRMSTTEYCTGGSSQDILGRGIIRQELLKLPLVAEAMIICIEDPKETTKNYYS